MREWGLRLALAGAGVALALLIGFVALQFIGGPAALIPCTPADGDWYITVRGLVYNYREPCATFYWYPEPGDEFHNHIRLNNYGLHDHDRLLEKPPGTYRILILGDSFAQGWQVALEEGFPALLEQQLNAEYSQRIEVINLSVDEYGTDRQLLLYAALGWRFQPDAVLLAFYIGNDIRDNSRALTGYHLGGYDLYRAFFSLDADGRLQLHDAPDLPPEQFPDSAAWQWLTAMSAAQTPAPTVTPPDVPPVIGENPRYLAYPVDLGVYLPPDEHWTEAWTLTEALLLQLRDLTGQQGSRFGVVLIPDRRAVHPVEWDLTTTLFPVVQGANPLLPGDRLDSFLALNGIPALNLTYTLGGWALSHPGERLYYGGDGHFNANGHAVTAQRIRFWLRQQGWLS